MIGFAKDDFDLLKQALVFTCTMQAVNQIMEHKDGSALTILMTASLLTYGAKLATKSLGDLNKQVLEKNASGSAQNTMLVPIYSVMAFVAQTLVSVGINFQANLMGTYFAGLFTHGTPPLFILFGTFNALILVWILGVAIGVVPLTLSIKDST